MFYTDANEKAHSKCEETRGDQIRNMTDYELAWVLMDFRFDGYAKASGDQSALPESQNAILEWLQQKEKVVV